MSNNRELSQLSQIASIEYVDVLGALGEGTSHTWDKTTFETAIAAQACTVTFVGTSIAVGTGESENSNTWVNRFKDALQYKYPDVVFTWNNLALGGRSLVNYNSAAFTGSADPAVNPSTGYYVAANPDTWPSGSTPGQTWKDAAESTSPDLFVLAHGMNDRDFLYIYQVYLNTAIDDALSWTKAPSILMVSEMLSAESMSGAERVSDIGNFQRWYAIHNGYGLLDVNRAYRAARDNVDCVRSVAQRQDSVSNWVQSGAAATLTADSLTNTTGTDAFITKTGDYAGMRFAFDFTPTTNQADWSMAANIISTGDTDNGCIYIERAHSFVVIRKRPIAGVEATFSTSAPVAATVESWDIRVKHTEVQIYRDGVLLGRFSHKQSSGTGSVMFGLNTGSATDIVCDLNEQPKVFPNAVATDVELLGVTQGAWQTGDFSVGGNSINHPSRLALSRIFEPVIRKFVKEEL